VTSISGGQPGDEARTRQPDEIADPCGRAFRRRPRTGGAGRAAHPHAGGRTFDAELEQRFLKRAGLDFTAVVVDTKEEFVRQLDAFRPGVVLSDFSLPGFSGRDALAITRERYPQLPFVFLSGVLGDEAAVELIKQGATDYVLKDQPARLVTVIRRASRRLRAGGAGSAGSAASAGAAAGEPGAAGRGVAMTSTTFWVPP